MAADEFTDLGTAGITFQGGFVVLRGYGCPGCGHGFWTEDDPDRKLANTVDERSGADPTCPHCDTQRAIPESAR